MGEQHIQIEYTREADTLPADRRLSVRADLLPGLIDALRMAVLEATVKQAKANPYGTG